MNDADDKQMLNRIRRLMMERDILLAAIAETDYAKVKEQLDAIAASPDE